MTLWPQRWKMSICYGRALVAELLASNAYGSIEARAAVFVNQGGGCPATFFNYHRELAGGSRSGKVVESVVTSC